MNGIVYAALSKEIVGAAFEVHNQLGPGFLEKIYEGALTQELRLRGIKVERQVHVPIAYKGVHVGEHILDLLVEGKVVVELKAIKEWDEVHKSIVLSYLKATSLPLAILLNFGKPSLEYKRVVR